MINDPSLAKKIADKKKNIFEIMTNVFHGSRVHYQVSQPTVYIINKLTKNNQILTIN